MSTSIKMKVNITDTQYTNVETIRTKSRGGERCNWVLESEAEEYANLKSLRVTSNGLYKPSDDDADGYSSVEVNVPHSLKKLTVTQNGTYTTANVQADGISEVTVNVVEAKLGEKTVTENNTYNALDDMLNGYSTFTVNAQSGGEYSYSFTRLADIAFNYSTGSTVVANGLIHTFGGSDTNVRKKHYTFDGNTTWTDTGESIPYNFYQGASVVYNNGIHLLGGSGGNQTHYVYDGENYEIASGLPYAFVYGRAVVYDGKIHIMGGNSSSTYTNHYAWDGTSWERVSTLPYNFQQGSAIVYGGEIHILGGSSSRKDHYAWDGSSWRSVSTLPRGFQSGFVFVDDLLHICSGTGGSNESYLHYSWNGRFWRIETEPRYEGFSPSITNVDAVSYQNRFYAIGSTKYCVYFEKITTEG